MTTETQQICPDLEEVMNDDGDKQPDLEILAMMN